MSESERIPLKKRKVTSDYEANDSRVDGDVADGSQDHKVFPQFYKDAAGDVDMTNKRPYPMENLHYQDDSSDSEEDDEEESFDDEKEEKSQIDSKKLDVVDSSGPAAKMMARMGYKAGEGLGKYGEGIKEPVLASTQKGRRGLGLKVKGFEGSLDETWEEKNEVVSATETVEWMPECDKPVPLLEEMSDWCQEGTKKLTIDNETEYCDLDTLQKLLACKSIFDILDPEEMRQARTRSNPYETIRGGIFQNRAAMKMANMDQAFDHMFTEPVNDRGKPLLGSMETLYFADICAGPGGFSEYVLWKKKWHAKGFGMTLKGDNDFKLDEFFTAPSEFFEPYYGIGGLEGDGDITNPENLKEFQRFVMENTDGKGVYFVMADGGISVEGQENIQEILTKQLVLCQFTCALSILREGGHFVCKIFDAFTPFTVGLIYLLYRCFDRLCLFKPITSRPANSERYVVCKGLRPGAMEVHRYMFDINLKLASLGRYGLDKERRDLLHVVPLRLQKEDQGFFDYITDSITRHAQVQRQALLKIQAYTKNNTLVEPRQAEIRTECLKLWKVPEATRTAPKALDTSRFSELCEDDTFSDLKILDKDNLNTKLKNIYDYKCLVSGDERWLILGLGKANVFKWKGRGNWVKLSNDLNIELPKDTILEGEFISERRGQGRGEKRILALHILDVLWLGGEDVRNKHFMERMGLAKIFTKALHKSSRTNLAPIRVKDIYRLERAEDIFKGIEWKVIKQGNRERLCYVQREHNSHYIPVGLYFVKTINDPWAMHLSRSTNNKYYFNTRSNKSVYETPPEAIAGFKSCQENRLFWNWKERAQIHDEQQDFNSEELSKTDILHAVQKQLNAK